MTAWNVSAGLMAKIQASIQPIKTNEPLRETLAQDFPRDCSNLPISGGWGYTLPDAIVFIRSQFPIPTAADFVPLEYHIAQKIIYEELIIFQPKNNAFSGIDLQLNSQKMILDIGRRYDVLQFNISCWSKWHWDQLKQEWEENDFGRRPRFDRDAHALTRDLSQVRYQRELWFDITDVFERR